MGAILKAKTETTETKTKEKNKDKRNKTKNNQKTVGKTKTKYSPPQAALLQLQIPELLILWTVTCSILLIRCSIASQDFGTSSARTASTQRHARGRLEDTMDVSKNRGTPKWMVYNGKSNEQMDDLGGTPTILGNTHMDFLNIILPGICRCGGSFLDVLEEFSAGLLLQNVFSVILLDISKRLAQHPKKETPSKI